MRIYALLLLFTIISLSSDGEQIILQFSGNTQIQNKFALSNPGRLVVDISTASYPRVLTNQFISRYQGKYVHNLRLGQFDKDTTRIVLDLKAAPGVWSADQVGNTVVISMKGGGGSARLQVENSPTSPSVAAPNAPVPIFKSTLDAKEAKKPIIVLDAGHGGKDTGAIGRQGTKEKEVVLGYALSIRHALLKTGRYKVVLTRDDDTYLFLPERVRIARQNKGDIFISLHADSNPNPDAEGFSVYTLSDKASDEEAAALAAQENKADIIGGMDLSTEDKTVAGILIDLAQRETNNKSSNLAEAIIANLNSKIPLLSNTHRYAGFRVLKAPDIPSVLIEIGFLSHRQDEFRIQSPEYRDKVSQSLIKALDSYFSE